MRTQSVITVPLLLFALLAGEAWAQTGTVTGTVTDAASLAPISSAQVYIPGLQIGTLSQANGRYLLVNVPTGTHTIRVERIGYATTNQDVTVTADQATEANLALAQDVLALDEIVVTGTAGQARRREIGNTIAQVNVGDLNEKVANVGSLLQGRLAGVRIVEGSGNSGSGADIRLRGNVSMSMSNQPLIYIDGMRSKSEPYPAPGRPGGRGTGGSMEVSSPLADLNPEDIERIEIVKGPAATTLYGTEAAAGVIQIFTKKGGVGGPAVWTADMQLGSSYMRPHYHEESPYLYAEPILRNGPRQTYAISVRGGATDNIGYFVSGQAYDHQGAWLTDYEKGGSIRANVQFQPFDDLRLELNNSFTRRAISNIQGGGTGQSIYFALARGDLAGYAYGLGARSPEVLRQATQQRNFTNNDRYLNSMTLTYTPWDNFTNRLTVGHDYAGQDVERVYPFCWRCGMGGWADAGDTGVVLDFGSVYAMAHGNRLRSIDYVGTLGFDLMSNLSTNFSFGFQGVESEEETIWASGRDFPGPGDYTVSSTARREGFQSKLRVITGGFFFQDMLALSDKYFLTLGLRVDGNSAFGSGLGLQPYPKASLSWVLSDEAYWPEALGQMKLRAAWGQAGRAPGAFDAVRTWDPVGWGENQAAFKPENLGNADLGPEKTTELELGFDASAFNNRLSAEVTYYSQNTRDALFAVPSPPTEGGWAAQLQNVGEISNSGLEATVNASIIQGANFGWDVGAGIMTNKSEVVLSGWLPAVLGIGRGRGWIIEGQPAPVVQGWRIENYYEGADPIITKDVNLGPAFPTEIFNLNTAITLPGGIVISGRVSIRAASGCTTAASSGRCRATCRRLPASRRTARWSRAGSSDLRSRRGAFRMLQGISRRRFSRGSGRIVSASSTGSSRFIPRTTSSFGTSR